MSTRPSWGLWAAAAAIAHFRETNYLHALDSMPMQAMQEDVTRWSLQRTAARSPALDTVHLQQYDAWRGRTVEHEPTAAPWSAASVSAASAPRAAAAAGPSACGIESSWDGRSSEPCAAQQTTRNSRVWYLMAVDVLVLRHRREWLCAHPALSPQQPGPACRQRANNTLALLVISDMFNSIVAFVSFIY